MGKLFQLRLLHFQQFLLLYQLSFLFLQFLFAWTAHGSTGSWHARRGRQPPTNRPATIGQTDCRTRQPAAWHNWPKYWFIFPFRVSIFPSGVPMWAVLHLHDESIVVDDGSAQDSFTGKSRLFRISMAIQSHAVATGGIYKRGIQFARQTLSPLRSLCRAGRLCR